MSDEAVYTERQLGDVVLAVAFEVRKAARDHYSAQLLGFSLASFLVGVLFGVGALGVFRG